MVTHLHMMFLKVHNSGNTNVDKQSTGWTASTAVSDTLLIFAGMTRDTTNFEDWDNQSHNNLHYAVDSLTLDTGYRVDTSIGSKEAEIDWSGSDKKATAAIAAFSLTSTGGTAAPTHMAKWRSRQFTLFFI